MRKIVLLICLMFSICVCGKTTYIPFYYSQINITGENGNMADSTYRRETFIMAKDGRYAVTVIHDSVTQERVKAIKRMKAAAGWSAFAMAMSGASAALTPRYNAFNELRYHQEIGTLYSAQMNTFTAMQNAEDMQKVKISIIVENLSEREMLVNDMNRGLTWYIPSKEYVELNVGNPEVNKFRIAYADCNDQKKDYVTIQAGNILEKRTLAFENDNCWVAEMYRQVFDGVIGRMKDVFDYYLKIDKISFERTEISKEELKQLKAKKI